MSEPDSRLAVIGVIDQMLSEIADGGVEAVQQGKKWVYELLESEDEVFVKEFVCLLLEGWQLLMSHQLEQEREKG